jgi:hypothetical protein
MLLVLRFAEKLLLFSQTFLEYLHFFATKILLKTIPPFKLKFSYKHHPISSGAAAISSPVDIKINLPARTSNFFFSYLLQSLCKGEEMINNKS